jgi:hypothetical protein
MPNVPEAHQCIIDGTAGPIRLPKPGDFNPFKKEEFSFTLSCTSKAKDASLALKARIVDGKETNKPEVKVGPEGTFALVGFNLTSGDPKDCCHQANIEANGEIHGALKVTKPKGAAGFDPGTSGEASVGTFTPGQPPDPVVVTVQLQFDDAPGVQCNGNLDGLRDRTSIVASVDCSRAIGDGRATCVTVGTIVKEITEIKDGVEQPPIVSVQRVARVRRSVPGVRLPVTEGYGFQEFKKFRERTEALVDVSNATVRAVASRDAAAKSVPETFADMSFNTKRLMEFDGDENETAILEK